LNCREKLKRKIKFIKESKTKIKFKRMRTKYEKIKNKIIDPRMKLKRK
jgi:hypothetical protein